ncbi:kinectin [Trypanosoma rangeli]|uniref:Kinectin n=1 Tax=Trypanosoma rangeli TaxID=5698 RepID=A0A422NS55_TRYRA|nr:kinectin [Trypanosoma rangeli]RNF08322.1 kinectin [Trypanosoma rangeli]|eukprot:RNF08322.1 kinectin [Trypanosoma rangeli]
MQSRYHTPTSASSCRSAEKPGSRGLESHDVVDSTRSSFASRMLLHVLSGRVLETQLDEGLAELMGGSDSLDLGSDDGSDNYDFGDDMNATSSTAVSVTPSMSLYSIARAEQMLQKTVPFVNGGRHIALTEEDVRRIRDKELLRFLETNSAIFVKYLQRRGEGAPAEAETPPPSTNEEVRTSIDIERELETLSRKIATFITAFDNDGEEYHICVDGEGKVLVPVAAEDEDEDRLSTEVAAAEEGGEDEISSSGCRDGENGEDVAAVHGVSVGVSGVVEDEVKRRESARGEVASTVPAEKTEVRASKVVTGETPLCRRRLGRSVRVRSPLSAVAQKTLPAPPTPPQQPQQLEKPRKANRAIIGTRQRLLPTRKQPSLPVRGVRLNGVQNQRIEEIMRTDFTKETSPYAMPMERLTALEERLRWFQEVRGPLGVDENNTIVDDSERDNYDEEASLSPPTQQQSEQQPQRRKTARELGDAYMREAREQRVFQSRMRAINARLSQLHDSLRMEVLCPAAGVERIAGVPRPIWSRDVPPPPSESDVAALLEDARRENAVAVEKGEPTAPPGGDKGLAHLQERLQLALRRAESLVTSSASSPLVP